MLVGQTAASENQTGRQLGRSGRPPGLSGRQPGLSGRQRGRLPIETTGFVGREAELARLGALLATARLVTVTGPGGIGKSRLALRGAAQAAPHFADGVAVVELASLREPELLPEFVTNALGLTATAPLSHLDALLSYLRERRLLLVLDTCEHLIDACAMLAEAVIAHAPGVTLLATSREPLDVSGENSCPLTPLPVPEPEDADDLWATYLRGAGQRANTRAGRDGTAAADGSTAVDLFLQRAAAAVPDFTVGPADLPDVIRLCRRLDGIPLAIELAAIRLRALPLAELVSRLDERMGILAGACRGGRHKTLRDAIRWSYDLCTPAEQAIWARLSVFAGPFSLTAAEQVCGGSTDSGQVLPTIIRLVDKSVLLRIEPTDGFGARYRMLDIIREFGAEQLAEMGAETAAKKRFTARYLSMATDFRDHFLDDDQLDRLRELRGEDVNLQAALEYSLESGDCPRAGDGVSLATALFWYWRARGLTVEGGRWLEAAATRAPADSPARAQALFARGYLSALRGHGELAVADADEVLRLGALLADERLSARGQLLRNLALGVAGRLTEAADAASAARRQLATVDDRPGLITLHTQLAGLALLNGDTEGALRAVERGLRMLGGARECWVKAELHLLASLALYLADRDIEANWTVNQALRAKVEADDVLGIAFTLEISGWLAARAGRDDRAAWLLGGADPRWTQTGGRLAAAPAFEQLHAEAVARASGALGDRRFAELFTRGTRHPLQELITYAASDTGQPGGEAGLRIRNSGQLTAREQQIAKLVAEGLSNRQIAERLFISRRTVDAHIEHIFGKLGITSRVVLAMRLRDNSGESANALAAGFPPGGLPGRSPPAGARSTLNSTN